MGIHSQTICNAEVNASDSNRRSSSVTRRMFPIDSQDNEESSLIRPNKHISLRQRSHSMLMSSGYQNGKSHPQNRSRSMDFTPNLINKPNNSSDVVYFDWKKGIVLNLHRRIHNDKTTSANANIEDNVEVRDEHSVNSTETFFHNGVFESLPFPFLERKLSIRSCVSALSYENEECPSRIASIGLTSNMTTRPRTTLVTWKHENSTPNPPHPSLECPPLYFLIRRFPFLLQYASLFYAFRWKMFRLLNRRIPLSRVVLRKVNVFLTFGDLLTMSPLFAALAVGIFYSFICPSVSVSGHAARIPLIFAFITAMRNSPLTLLIGIPFERALWYHKWSARVAYINGLFHTYACFVYPVASNEEDGILPKTSLLGSEPNLWKFLFADQVNCGGSFLIIFMSLMMVTAFPCIRRRFFEAFQYLHMAFVASMIVCAFYHTGIIVPICASFSWGLDLLIRKVYMPLYRYPKFASLRIISETVLEFCFPKSPGFDYNPGQYIYICIPEISFLEWHPFSLSSSPEQKIVTLHIRNVGNWTSRLFDLAKSRHEVSVLLEGPYGSVGVDLISNEYKSIILLSGGIGVTPMQSLCNQLMYDHRKGIRKLNKLSFIWVERDPHVMPKVDVIRRHISSRYPVCSDDAEIGRDIEMQHEVGIASTLLSIIPASTMNEDQFEQEYGASDIDDDDFEDDFYDEESEGQNLRFISTDDDTMNQTFLDDAYCWNNEHNGSGEPLDLQVYLTSKEATKSIISNYPFVRHSRPDVPLLFKEMRLEALARGEKCVAVCICAPKRLVLLCKKACAKYSDRKLRFDLHYEVF